MFSGGGNRGAIQVGMLKALLGAGVQPDLLFGASVGAINAAALASDPTPAGVDRLADTWLGLRDDTIFPHHHYGGWRFIQQRQSVYPSEALRRIIEAFLPYERLEDAVLPLEVVASSLSGRERWITSGSATDALLASAAIPGVFPPVTLDGEVLIDGGVLDDVPISRALERGAQRIFALLCGPLLPEAVPAARPVEALLAAFAVAVRGRFVRETASVPDGVQLVVIGCTVPRLQGYWDFSRTAELMAAGEASARRVLTELGTATVPAVGGSGTEALAG